MPDNDNGGAASEANSRANSGTAPALEGVRVLELGSFVAAPMATRMLADFGAEVIKVELPGRGDELRGWGVMLETSSGPLSAWWLAQARNKRLITLDLRQPAGRDLALRLIEQSDIVIENFRPGRINAWGLDYESMRVVNPRIVLAHISGYGQTGPYSNRAGYGHVSESMGGLRYVTGFPDQPPVRVGVSLGDALAAQQTVFGALMALRVAERTGEGQEVDVAITEAVYALTEDMITAWAHLGIVRERAGNSLLRAAPSSVYLTQDQHWLAIGGNGENVFRRLAQAMGQPELASDPRFCDNRARITHIAELDEIIGAWVAGQPLAATQASLDAAGVPAGPVMSIADIAANEQYQARGMIASVPDARLPEGAVTMQGIIPRLTETPGALRWAGGDLGADNAYVYSELLGLSPAELERLSSEGVI